MLVNKVVLGKRLHGCKVCQRATLISHLLFGDDALMFLRATEEKAGTVKEVLNIYERASG